MQSPRSTMLSTSESDELNVDSSDALVRLFETVQLLHDSGFASVISVNMRTIPFIPLNRLHSSSLRSAVLALATFLQIGATSDETLRRETRLCAETLAAIQEKDFVKVFYCCFIRCIPFSLSKRFGDIQNECLGLSATFKEIRKLGIVEPEELFIMESLLQWALHSLVHGDDTSVPIPLTETPCRIDPLVRPHRNQNVSQYEKLASIE